MSEHEELEMYKLLFNSPRALKRIENAKRIIANGMVVVNPLSRGDYRILAALRGKINAPKKKDLWAGIQGEF